MISMYLYLLWKISIFFRNRSSLGLEYLVGAIKGGVFVLPRYIWIVEEYHTAARKRFLRFPVGPPPPLMV